MNASVGVHKVNQQACVDLYARAIDLMQLGHPVFGLEWALIIVRDLPELCGKDLCCWCKPGDPCHADLLLELANRKSRPVGTLRGYTREAAIRPNKHHRIGNDRIACSYSPETSARAKSR
jgi:hypothetical protein